MPNRNAYLAVVLEDETMRALGRAAEAIAADPAELLCARGAEVTFNPVEGAVRHMTFLFFGEHLRQLPAKALGAVHAALEQGLARAAAEGAAEAPMAFRGFEFFPPGKANLIVAAFEPTRPLERLREAVLQTVKDVGVALPVSFFAQLEGEGPWAPHVTLGKIGASKAQLGRLSCDQEALLALAPQSPARPRGLTLLGERPQRAWFDWDEALAFEAQRGDAPLGSGEEEG
mmetsp:Transcript_30411/g.94361  ORF Transcript_30411/g.94361 Transcript_30411/m.94361 type:complete len:230 (-) Transcript_30411:231-920(-)